MMRIAIDNDESNSIDDEHVESDVEVTTDCGLHVWELK